MPKLYDRPGYQLPVPFVDEVLAQAALNQISDEF